MLLQTDRRGAAHFALRDQSGKVNIVSLLLVAALVGVGYGGYVYTPLYLQHLDVKQRCQESLNSTWRHRSPQRTKDDILRRLHDIDTVEKEIGGDLRKVPAIDPGDFLEVRMDESVRPPVLSIDISYDREVALPLLGRTHIFYFSAYGIARSISEGDDYR